MKAFYKTVSAPGSGEYREKGSRFLATVYPVCSEDEVKELIAAARKEHPKAVHHCYAYRIGADQELFRFSDDREPPGSAGRPIFGVIQSEDLTNVLIIVVRYFGGTQLGIPGLINAYREAARTSVLASEVVQVKIMLKWQLSFPVSLAGQVMRALKKGGAVILEYQSDALEHISCEIGTEEGNTLKHAFLNEYPYAGNVTLKQI